MAFSLKIIQRLIEIDTEIFLFLNHLHHPVLDNAMWLVSDRWIWIPFYTFLLVMLMRRQPIRKSLFCVAMIVIAIAASDQICANLLRPAIERLRPSCPDNPISAVVHTVNGYHGGRYGFPSCHAANSFALAFFLSLYFQRRNVAILLFSWAMLVSYSRIYLGVHYPGDILGGLLVGCACSGSAYGILTSLRSR